MSPYTPRIRAHSSVPEKIAAAFLIIAISLVWYATGPLTILAAGITTMPDSYTTAEDTPLHVAGPSVLANDTASTTLTIGLASNASHGSVVFNMDNSFDYTPIANFNGIDTFTYTAGDGISTSSPETVTITVTPVNDAPVSQNQDLATAINTASSSVLMASDVDASTTLSYAISSQPSHGIVTLVASTGNFTYTPTAGFIGVDSFRWNANDGTSSSTDATVTVDFAPQLGVSFVIVNDDGGTATSSSVTLAVDGATTTGATSTRTIGGHTVSAYDIYKYTKTIGGDCAADGTIILVFGASKHCVVTFNDIAQAAAPAATEEEKKPANGPISSVGPSFGTITNFSGSVLGASTSLPELPAGCVPVLGSFMRSSKIQNNPDDVKKLQEFLNSNINAGIAVTGQFGGETDSAVRAFQTKNADQILKPWGLNKPTGFVYLTTQRWINLMSCATLDIPMPKLVPYVTH